MSWQRRKRGEPTAETNDSTRTEAGTVCTYMLTAREIAKADDAKREAEARKITAGEHRTKRRGRDFVSDDEEDGDGYSRRKRNRWAKIQRKIRKLDSGEGLAYLREC